MTSVFRTKMKFRSGDTATILIATVAILILLTVILGFKYPWMKMARIVLLGGFIGGFTNRVAIRMMFEKYWYLPGSGVLLKKREQIIQSLADTVELHIINPQLLEDKLRKAIEKVDAEKIKNTLNAVIDEFRADMLVYINSKNTHKRIVGILKKKLGPSGRLLDFTGLKDYDLMAHEILDYLDSQVEEFRITEAMLQTVISKTGTLEEFIFRPENPLLIKHYGSRESLAALLFNPLFTTYAG